MPRKSTNNEQSEQGNLFNSQLDEIRNTVVNTLHLPCERLGDFLWVDCMSSKYVEPLEKLGFRFSAQRYMWYYTNKQPKTNGYRRYYSMDQLRTIFNQNGLIAK